MESTDKTTTRNAHNGGYADAKHRTESLAHDAVDRTVRGAHDSVNRATEALGRAKESLGEKGEEARNATEHAVAQTRTYMKRHPVAAVGIAVAAGLILSQLLRSGSR